MLNERMKGDREEPAKPAPNPSKPPTQRDITNQSKSSDPGKVSAQGDSSQAASQLNTNVTSGVVPPAKPSVQPPLTEDIVPADTQTDGQSVDGKANGNGNVPADPPSADSSSLLEKAPSESITNPNSGSMLLARLMQSRTGMMSLPAQPQVKAGAPEKKPSASSSSETALPSSLNGLIPTLSSNLSSIAVPKDDGISIAGSKSAGVVAPVEGDAPQVAAAAVVPGHLAFALRLNVAADSSAAQATTAVAPEPATTPNPAVANPAASVASSNSVVGTAALGSDTEKKEHSDGGDAQDRGNASAPVELPTPVNSNGDASTAPNETPAATQLPIDERLQEYSSDPVQNVQMQVIGDDNRRVDIRLIDRAGELRVSVKSGDSTLNRTLQSKMPELTSRLQSAQYDTEIWMPTSTEQDQSSGDSNADAQKGQQQRPDWVEDLEGSTPNNSERN